MSEQVPESPWYRVHPEAPLYRRASKREAATWGRQLSTASRQRSLFFHPRVQEHYTRALTGSAEAKSWESWVRREYGPVESALSLGAGHGAVEERLIELGMFRSLTAVDLSERAVDLFRQRLRKRGFTTPVDALPQDLNAVRLPEKAYDLILANSILHHVINLEHLLEQCRRALKPGGRLIVHDYVGPNRLQWPDATLEEVNDFIERSRKRHPELKLYPVRRPNPNRIREYSPFESIRSGEIVDAIHQGFRARHEALTAHLVVPAIIYGAAMDRDRWDDPVLTTWIDRLFAREREAAARGEIPPARLLGVYGARSEPIPRPEPWSKSEVKARIGLKPVSLRKLALDMLEMLPFRRPVIEAWKRVRVRFGWY